ncbi:hypothetical protein ACLKA6_016557 [Drosophila palustris]
MSASGRYDAYDAQLGLLKGTLASVSSQIVTPSSSLVTKSTTTLPQVFLKPSPPPPAVDGLMSESVTSATATAAHAAHHLPTKYL